MKPLFGRGPSLQLRLFFTVLVSVACIVADARFHLFDSSRVYMNSLVSPLIYLANLPKQLVGGVRTQFRSRESLMDENDQLQQQLFLVRGELLRLQQLTQENQRLHQLLGSPINLDARKMVAQIMAVDSDPFVHQVVIDKGTLNGVYDGQPVLNDQGVVGQVLSVGKTTSRVLLITDASHALPVRIARNDIRAIASGTGSIDELELKNITRNADIQEGDLLVTSGLGGRFPMGYPVARITRFAYEEGKPFAEVKAKPLAELDRLRYLLLLWPADQGKQPILAAPSAAMSTASAATTTEGSP
ncbi:rod shape-determining protein MreC [Pseudaeromonas sp. ZJS20]|uniref:rod shape-determining protein MreC n=1 Tax=Pseudaeromonas aegiceratis TaxID=3153928 RepID=UPI00390C76A7